MRVYWVGYYRLPTIVALGIEVNETKFIDINSLSGLLKLTVEASQHYDGALPPRGRMPYV
jgi:hypothetical protein